MRLAAVVQALILVVLALVVLDAAGLMGLGWTGSLTWLPWVSVASPP